MPETGFGCVNTIYGKRGLHPCPAPHIAHLRTLRRAAVVTQWAVNIVHSAMRIEAVRRIFPRCRFDEKKCSAGIEALGFYHERKDEQRSVRRTIGVRMPPMRLA